MHAPLPTAYVRELILLMAWKTDFDELGCRERRWRRVKSTQQLYDNFR